MSIFTTLISAYPTWEALKTHLVSEEGGNLSVYEVDHLAMIRYVKGVSNMSKEHVGAFRSVVWDTTANKPVSVTAFKSEKGEGLPPFNGESNILMEEFVDGVMIGQFWDSATEKWRIHTRSVLDAKCRYFSTRSFAELFAEAAPENLEARLDKGVSYTWILQHPENRIVCPVRPRLVLVAAYSIGADAELKQVAAPEGIETPRCYYTKTDAPAGRLDMTAMIDVVGMVNRTEHDQEGASHIAPGYVPVDMMGVISMIASMRGSVRYQGVVIKTTDPYKRWKIRSQVYNQVRKMRGNTARRDYLWMDMWSKGGLEEYLKFFPEERLPANNIINRWKSITQSVYNLYVDAFKARTLDRSQIPNKFRPLVYGLHNLYMTGLKPARKSLDWRAAVQWMNERDTAQKVFVLNWDLRQERSAALPMLPLEPAPTAVLRASAEHEAAPAAPQVTEREEGEI
jgi:hypothetical protein